MAPWFAGRQRGRLVRHYFLISVALISGGLITSGLVEIYFRYQESLQHLALLQQESTTGAAFKIEHFIQQIEHDMKAAAKSREITEKGLTPDYRFELRKLLTVARAITEVVALDSDGVARAAVSRFGLPLDKAVDGGGFHGLQQARQGKSYFGPVYFVRSSEPYMTIAVPIERFAGETIGVLQGEVNLKYVWEVVSGLKIGKSGYAYAAARNGDLIAHPEISLVLQRRNVAHLEQIKTAFDPVDQRATGLVTENLEGKKVFSSVALIPNLDWAVFIEQPVDEVYGPIYASMLRTAGLLLMGFGLAVLASLFLARRVVRPLESLRHGVERIGRGDLGFRVKLKTGDEIEQLADEFNKMTGALLEAYAGLEQKVRERTEQLMAANEKLTELDRLKSDFVSNVSHELRTPLTAIKGSIDNMLDGLTGPLNEKQIRYLTRIKGNTDRLARLINDLLDLSKIEAGKIELRQTRVSLTDLAKEVTEALRPMAMERRISLDVRGSNVTAWADRDRVGQVLMNLIGNALKFTPADGQVTVKVRQNSDGLAELSVSDTGPGIPQEETERIFDRFYQIARSDKDKTRGTGLGLTISKALVEIHGGRIWIESQARGGSIFCFTLPVAPPVERASA